VLLAVAAAAVYAWAKGRPVAVDVAQVRRGPIEECVTEEAKTRLHVERVVTALLAGTVARITLEEGDRVRAGQVLTTIEDTDLRLSLDMTEAVLKEVQGRLAGADVTLPKPSEIQAAEQSYLQALAEVEALEKDLEAARADAEYARKDAARVKKLLDSGAATERDYDVARRELERSEAVLEGRRRRLSAGQTAARVALLRKQVLLDSMGDTAHLHQIYGAQAEQVRRMMDLLEHRISRTRVKSPIDGIVLEKYLDSQQHVQAGTPLLRVGDPGSIEVRADILSEEVGRVHPGQKVYLVGRAIPSGRTTGIVKKVYPSGFTKVSALGVRQQRVAVLIGFDNSSLHLKPGYRLDVKIVVAARDEAVLAPSEAVFATPEGAAVFVVEGGRARLRPVQVGLKGDEEYEISAGLSPGEKLILRPPTDLKPGSRVRARGP